MRNGPSVRPQIFVRGLVIGGLLSLLAQAAAAQVSCSEDYFGHVRCTGSAYSPDSSGSSQSDGNLSGGGGVSGDPSNAAGPEWHSDEKDADWYVKRQDEIGCIGEAQRSGNYPGADLDNYVVNCMSELEKDRN